MEMLKYENLNNVEEKYFDDVNIKKEDDYNDIDIKEESCHQNENKDINIKEIKEENSEVVDLKEESCHKNEDKHNKTESEVKVFHFVGIKEEDSEDINTIQEVSNYVDGYIKEEQKLMGHYGDKTWIEYNLGQNNRSLEDGLSICEDASLNKPNIKQHNASENIFVSSDVKSSHKNCSANINLFRCIEGSLEPSNSNVSTVTSENSFICSKCNFKTSEHLQIMLHIEEHEEESLVESSNSSHESLVECNNSSHDAHIQYIQASSESSDSNVATGSNESSFICSKCNYKTFQQLQMMLHIEGHEVESSVEYIESNQDTCVRHIQGSSESLDSNVTTVSSKDSFICGKCNFKTSQQLQMMIHIAGHKVKSSVECTESNKDSSIRHIQGSSESSDSNATTVDSKDSFICSKCNFKTFQQLQMMVHIEDHEVESSVECIGSNHDAYVRHKQGSSEFSDSSGTNLNSKDSFICSKCNFKTSQHLEMMLHIEGHEVELSVEDHDATSKPDKKHQHSKEKKSFKCNYCDFKSSKRSCVRDHIRTHTGEKPFKCGSCDFAASQKSILIRHIRTHTGERPYKCKYCDYRAMDQSCLQGHVRIHTGYKPFSCRHCDFSTSKKSNFEDHIRIHTGERPFKCTLCDYAASRKWNIYNHMKTHTGERSLRCNDCDYATSRRSDLKRHFKIHDR